MAVKQNNIKARNIFAIYNFPSYRKGLLSPVLLIYLGVGKPINTLIFLLDLHFSSECTASVAHLVQMAKGLGLNTIKYPKSRAHHFPCPHTALGCCLGAHICCTLTVEMSCTQGRTQEIADTLCCAFSKPKQSCAAEAAVRGAPLHAQRSYLLSSVNCRRSKYCL